MPPATTLEKPAAGKIAEKVVDTQAVKSFGENFLSREPEPESPQKKTEREAAEKKAALKKVATPPKKKPVVAAPAAPTAAEIGTAVATEVARVLKPAEKEAEKTAEEPELTPEETRRIANLSHMEQLLPDKYKGLADKYKASMKKLADYAAEWEKANPGREYDEDAEEHKAFYDANNVDWSDEDYTEAVADLRVKKAVGEVEGKYKEKFGSIEQREALQAAAPAIEKAKVTAARAFFKDLGEQFVELVSENGAVNNEKLTALKSSEPETHKIIIAQAEGLEVMTAENYKLFNRLVSCDLKNNPTHATINGFILGKEKTLLAKPKAEQLNEDGKPFLPAADYWKLPENKRGDFWTFRQADIEYLLVRAATKRAKFLIQTEEEKFISTAKARGITLPDKKQPAVAVKTEEQKPEEVEEEIEDGKPLSPSSPGSIRQPAGGKREDASDAQSVFRRRMLGKL